MPQASSCFRPSISTNLMWLASSGRAPSDGDPHFHQQMVYAVAMRTIHLFEHALGRPIHWEHGWESKSQLSISVPCVSILTF